MREVSQSIKLFVDVVTMYGTRNSKDKKWECYHELVFNWKLTACDGTEE